MDSKRSVRASTLAYLSIDIMCCETVAFYRDLLQVTRH